MQMLSSGAQGPLAASCEGLAESVIERGQLWLVVEALHAIEAHYGAAGWQQAGWRSGSRWLGCGVGRLPSGSASGCATKLGWFLTLASTY